MAEPETKNMKLFKIRTQKNLQKKPPTQTSITLTLIPTNNSANGVSDAIYANAYSHTKGSYATTSASYITANMTAEPFS